ncbi:MAG: hypothetical protein LCH44_14410 [Bacteroidetes bacterium]|nr:hypothetical protein [Bacteroidota bacterium]MCB0605531.1 hypothetical protein [Saprospiraceae bacterium]
MEQRILTKDFHDSRMIALDLTGHNGVVFIQIASLKGDSEAIKHIIIN